MCTLGLLPGCQAGDNLVRTTPAVTGFPKPMLTVSPSAGVIRTSGSEEVAVAACHLLVLVLSITANVELCSHRNEA